MRRANRAPASQHGSVYVITLVVLLVLTVLGLSIALITQSEMQIGTNERMGETMFYAADSGIEVATAKALVIPDLRRMRLDQVVPTALPGLNVRNRVDVSRFRPILTRRAICARSTRGSPTPRSTTRWMRRPTGSAGRGRRYRSPTTRRAWRRSGWR